MTHTRLKGAALALALAGALAAPAGADAAASTTSQVTGLVGTELSLAAATPAVMTFNHTTPGTTSSLVTVTSTQASWTLSIADQNTGANAGKMLKTAGLGTPAVGSALANPLEWSANGGSTYTNLSSTPATVGTGSLIGTKTVSFRQGLSGSEAVSAGDTYGLTAVYTVSP